MRPHLERLLQRALQQTRRCSLSPFQRFVMCSDLFSGQYLVAPPCFWPGRGGDDATVIAPDLLISNVVCKLGNFPAPHFLPIPPGNCLMTYLSHLPRNFLGKLLGKSQGMGSELLLALQKGVLVMTLFSLKECCALLAI